MDEEMCILLPDFATSLTAQNFVNKCMNEVPKFINNNEEELIRIGIKSINNKNLELMEGWIKRSEEIRAVIIVRKVLRVIKEIIEVIKSEEVKYKLSVISKELKRWVLSEESMYIKRGAEGAHKGPYV